MQTGEYIVQQPYIQENDNRWYVQQISLLDYGRFSTREAAIEFLDFLHDKEASR